MPRATLSEWVQIEGEAGESSAIQPDSSLIKQVNGKEIELSLSNTLSNEEVVLAYHIQDAKTKQGINNLEPYLGAVGHVVILSEDAEQYIHVHPLDERSTGPCGIRHYLPTQRYLQNLGTISASG